MAVRPSTTIALRANTWTSRVRCAYQRSRRSRTCSTVAGIFCSTLERRNARRAWAEVQATARALIRVAAKTKKLTRAARLRNVLRIHARTDDCIEEPILPYAEIGVPRAFLDGNPGGFPP